MNKKINEKQNGNHKKTQQLIFYGVAQYENLFIKQDKGISTRGIHGAKIGDK